MSTKSILEQLDQAVKQQEGRHRHVRLSDDGDTFEGVFLGELHFFEMVFEDGMYHPFTDEMKYAGRQSSTCVSCNIASCATGKVKVVELPLATFLKARSIFRQSPIEDWRYRIERQGEAGSKTPHYTIKPTFPLTSEERKFFQALRLHDLPALTSLKGNGATTTDPATDVIDTLKLPSDGAVDQFRTELGSGRVVDLPTERAVEVGRILDQPNTETSQGNDDLNA